MAPAGDAFALVRRHLEAIARSPRPAGGAAEAAARAHCAAELRAMGFRTRELEFSYSAFPGRWATPSYGLASPIVLAVALVVAQAGSPRAALAIALAALALMGALGVWLSRQGVMALPLMRRQGVNLEAQRGDGEPRVWLVAHVDCKSQPVPMALRVAGVVGTVLAWLAMLTALSLAASGRAPAGHWWTAIAALATLAAIPVMASVVGAQSDGAVDDASGVATVLAAARLETSGVPLGVLLTSAEELGMAGARAWVAARRSAGMAPGIAINCDGVDDAGALTLMRSGPVPRTAAALGAAARARGVALVQRRLVPGILADSVALSDAGWEAPTVSLGGWHTLARVHRPADSLAALEGRGAALAALVIADALAALGGEA